MSGNTKRPESTQQARYTRRPPQRNFNFKNSQSGVPPSL